MLSGVKILALPTVPSAQSTDVYPIVQGGITYKESVSQLVTLLNSPSVLTGFVPITGGTMTGPLILSGDPVLPLGAATKQYVDTFASGLTVVLSCAAATTANLNATQAGAGIGATLTNAGAMAAFAVDGYSASLNDRILVKNQTLSEHNGIYTVTTVGSGAVNWVLTRATDYDTNTQIIPGTLVAVNNGTVNGTTSWLETATVVIVDTDPVLFSQFTFSPSSFLLAANNLSDLPSVSTALVNLGLGVPTGTGNVVRQTSPTLITPTLGVATATSLAFSPTTSGIVGTTTNDNASAGFVGEFISSIIPSGSAVVIPRVTATNLTSISLTAGDWDVWGNVFFVTLGTAATVVTAWTSSTSASVPDESLRSQIGSSVTIGVMGIAVPYRRYSLSVTTTIYLSGFLSNSSGNGTFCGSIYARRVR